MKLNFKPDIKKLLIAAIAVVVVASSIGLGYYIAGHPSDRNKKPAGGAAVSQDSTSSTQESGQTQPSSSDVTNTTFSQSATQKELLIGSWRDSANFSGYEFFENGTMKVTYFNMAAVNLENVIEGTFSGTYTVEGDKLTISYTMYSKTRTDTYTFKVDTNTLIMKKGAEEAVYMRGEISDTPMDNVDRALLGSWTSNLSGYEFKENGVVGITFIDLGSMGINIPINGTVNGTYTINGNELKVMCSIYTGVIEKNYTYTVNGDTLTLIDKKSGEKGIYTRKN